MAEAQKTPTTTERESGLPRAYMVRLLGTSTKAKQIFAPGPEVIKKLADYLRINYEWLAIGRGPMRAEGYSPSAFEEASFFAVRHGARRDAIEAAAARHRDVANMTGTDWILAINAEAQRLDREGIPRPEVVEKQQQKVRRIAARDRALEAKLDELRTEIAELEAKKQEREGDDSESPPKRKRRPARA